MSALDQAIIKAFAKDRSSPVPTAPAAADAHVGAFQPAPRGGQSIERLYHEGVLYRVEVAKRGKTQSEVPAPHLPTLPPTSPRRNVRRSMLKLLAAGRSAPPPELPANPPPRVARKVIIRHVSHSAAPAPMGLLRPATEHHLVSLDDESTAMRSDLPPETTADEPAPTPTEPISPFPTIPPQVAPLNVAELLAPQIELCDSWSAESIISPLVVVAETSPSPQDLSGGIVFAEIDSLIAAEAETQNAEVSAPLQSPIVVEYPPFAAKSLEEQDEPRLEIRYDPSHATQPNRPHARFGVTRPAPEPPTPAAQPPASEAARGAASLTHEELELLLEDDAADYLPAAAEELALADAVDQPLASDLIPVDSHQPSAARGHATPAPPAAEKKPAAPLWEVDRFHWPRTCEKLLADEAGYLSRAGEKLLAAVADGLRVLAITGSRRGEGRTTLALCLSRTAAKAGIQTAIMDADFARPQLASKIALEVAYGWQDAALGRIPLNEAAVKSLGDNIVVLPLESSAATRSLSLADPRVTATIRAAAASFELLILDLGPVTAGQGIEFPPGEDCPLNAAIVVRDLRFATASEGEAIGQMLIDTGVEAVGIAENFAFEEAPAQSP